MRELSLAEARAPAPRLARALVELGAALEVHLRGLPCLRIDAGQELARRDHAGRPLGGGDGLRGHDGVALGLHLEEAALVDGASRLQVFRQIVLPVAFPGIIAASIFSLIVSWNDYLFGRVFMNSLENMPLTVGVMHFFEGTHVDWGLMMASSVLMTVPMAILFMLLQRHLVAGFGAGAVKG